jgi:hypothetical protein
VGLMGEPWNVNGTTGRVNVFGKTDEWLPRSPNRGGPPGETSCRLRRLRFENLCYPVNDGSPLTFANCLSFSPFVAGVSTARLQSHHQRDESSLVDRSARFAGMTAAYFLAARVRR